MAPQNWKSAITRKSASVRSNRRSTRRSTRRRSTRQSARRSICQSARGSIKRRITSYSPSHTCIPSLSVSLSSLNSEPVTKAKPIENKILYYLRRLKDRYWNPPSLNNSMNHPIPPYKRKETGKERFGKYNYDNRKDRVNKNVMKPMEPRPSRYSSSNQYTLEKRYDIANPRLPILEELANTPCKAQDIVSAAIEYGLANGIVSKNGKYFWMSEGRLAERSMTPGYALRKNHRLKNADSPKNKHPSLANTFATPRKGPSIFSCNSSLKQKSFSKTPTLKVESLTEAYSEKMEKKPFKTSLNKKTVKAVKTRKNVKCHGSHKKKRAESSRPISVSSSSDESMSSGYLDVNSPPRKKKKKSVSKPKNVF